MTTVGWGATEADEGCGAPRLVDGRRGICGEPSVFETQLKGYTLKACEKHRSILEHAPKIQSKDEAIAVAIARILPMLRVIGTSLEMLDDAWPGLAQARLKVTEAVHWILEAQVSHEHEDDDLMTELLEMAGLTTEPTGPIQ